MDRIFKPPFSMTGVISQDRERCQFLVASDKKPTVVMGSSAKNESGET